MKDMNELLNRLKQEYLREFPEKISNLEELYAQKDWEGLRNNYHKLKGSGKTYGVDEVSDVATVMEKVCATQPQKIDQLFFTSIELLTAICQAHLSGQELGSDAKNSLQTLKNLAKK